MKLTEYLGSVEDPQAEVLEGLPVPEEAAEIFVARVRRELAFVQTETGVSDFEIDQNLGDTIAGQYNRQTGVAKLNADILLEDNIREHVMIHEGLHDQADAKEDAPLTDVDLIEGLTELSAIKLDGGKTIGAYDTEVADVIDFATQTMGSVSEVIEMYKTGQHEELEKEWDEWKEKEAA